MHDFLHARQSFRMYATLLAVLLSAGCRDVVPTEPRGGDAPPVGSVSATTSPSLIASTDFSEYPVGLKPADWQHRWITTGGTLGSWRVQRDSTGQFEGNSKLVLTTPSSVRRALSWDRIGERANVRAHTRLRLSDDTLVWSAGITVVGAGHRFQEGEIGYSWRFRHLDGFHGVQLMRFVNGVNKSLVRIPFPYEANKFYHLMLERNGDALRGKVWADGSPEPDWQVAVTDTMLKTGWVALDNQNKLTVEFDFFRVYDPTVQQQSAQIGSTGGTLQLPSLASFTFPADFFATSRLVQVSRTEDAHAMERFTEFEGLFRVGTKTPYQVRLLAGDTPPTGGTFQAVLTVPDSMVIPAGHRPKLFVQVYEDGGEETLDNFQLISSSYDPATRTLTASLPAYVFTNMRRSDGLYEALFMIGTTPGGANTTSSLSQLSMTSDPEQCKAAFIACPLGIGCEETSAFAGARPHPVTGEVKPHFGTDLKASNGTQVLAAADGKIERIRHEGENKGYGLYMIVRHTDGSATLYAHLHETTTIEGQPVKRGDPIAVSNNSGFTRGPHLHLEYVPNGEIVKSEERIDPMACIKERTAKGSITVNDNGSLADDAFAVYLNDTHLGTTEIGASNTFAINNLIPGAHTLRIVGVVVPDDIGTYEVALSDGITFSGGGTYYSGVVGNGGSATFAIIVPSTTTSTVSPTLQMRPSTVVETRPNPVPEGKE